MSGTLNGGSIRVLWDADDTAEVTITAVTGATVAFTVGGSAVTFPYTLSASTTFETDQSGRYEVSVTHHGIEIANTPDGTRFVNLANRAQEIFAPTPDAQPTTQFLADLMDGLSATYVKRGELVVYVDDHGTLTSGTDPAARAGNDAALTAALAACETGDSILTGRIVRFPRGRFMLSPFTLTNTDPAKIASITLEGEGQHNTIIDFAGTTGDGITIPGTAGISIRNLHVRSASGHNIAAYGTSSHDAEGASLTTNSPWLTLEGVRTQFAGESGLFLSGTYLTSVSDVLALSNGTHGVEVGGYTTSTSFRNVQARDNTLSGWKINDTTYSSWSGCAADLNGGAGYEFSNVRGLSLSGTGAESNDFDGFLFQASAALATGAIAPDITGVTLAGCFGYNNGLTSTAYANFVRASATDGKACDVVLVGCADQSPPADRSSLRAEGTSSVTQIGTTLAGATVADATAATSAIDQSLVWRGPAPTIALRESDGPADEKNWDWVLLSGQFRLRGRDDALSTAENIYVVDRTGPNATTHQWFTSGTERMRLTSAGLRLGGGTGPLVTTGAGSPEGVVTAPVGSLYQRTDGGAGTTLYVKESGTGNTGWVAK